MGKAYSVFVVIFYICSLSSCAGFGSGTGEADEYFVLKGIATPEACLISNTSSLENKFLFECDPDSATVIETCLNWLTELEGIAEPEHAQIKLLMATTYHRLSEIKRWTMLPTFPHLNGQGDKLLSIEQYQENARELAQKVYDEDRSNTQAMGALALTSGSDWRYQAVNYQGLAG